MKTKFSTNLIMTLLFLGSISSIYGQEKLPPTEVYNKLGNDPFKLDSSAALEIESTTRGFLPPRMTEAERKKILSPAPGLIVWCKDCNKKTTTASGQFCVYLKLDSDAVGNWIPLTMSTTPSLTTNPATKGSAANSVDVSGTLVDFGATPTETGVVFREITDDNFATLPVLVDAVTLNKISTDPTVTAANSPITATISGLSSANPYYFRTYAKSSLGIGYGNTVIFNSAPPKFSTVTVTNGTTLFPVFTGKLTVNAGSSQNTITEYGYCTSATNPDPKTTTAYKVVLSTTATGSLTLDVLNDKLNSETFTANPAISLLVNDYNVIFPSKKTYFRYYAVANGETIYSNVVDFTPVADSVGGSAIVTLGTIEPISKPLKAGENSTSSFTVHFKVAKAGSYSFTPAASTGATTNLTMPAVNGNFDAAPTDQTVTFTINGLPKTSLAGCSFVIPGIGTLSTGQIELDATIEGNIPVGSKAFCGSSDKTTVAPLFSLVTGRVWMDRNLGASSTGTYKNDITAYGCTYQWGRGNDGHASINWTSTTAGTSINGTTVMNARSDTPGNQFIPINDAVPYDWRSTPNSNLWQGVKGINNPCPTGFRVPTIDELYAELVGVTNAETAYSSSLKLTYTHFTMYYGGSNSTGAAYWSSTADGNNYSYDIWFDSTSGSFRTPDIKRGYGLSVRCIKN